MKIAIQTIVDYNNYGNRLQNYALQEVLKKQGNEVITLKNNFKNPYLPTITSENKLNKIIKSIKDGSFFRKFNNQVRLRKKEKLVNKYYDARYKSFEEFSSKYIAESMEVYDENLKESDELKSFDCFFIGSDQVWNFEFPRFSTFDFLPSVTQPKISYAASFGVDAIPLNLKEIYSENLSTIDYISVREDKGKHIISDLLPNRNVKVVLDPTLMLSKLEWEKLIQDRQDYDKEFILTYFLDEPTKEDQKYILKISREKNLVIKQFANVFDEELWLADPAEFVNLFSQAEMVFTDSFHACVFSIIFEKYFEVFERNTQFKSMNSRIETLISTLNTGNRWHRGNSVLLENPNYKIINKNLDKKREESFEYIMAALNGAKKMIKVEKDV